MKRLPLLVLSILFALLGVAVAVQLIDDTHNQTVGGQKTHVTPIFGGVTFAQLTAEGAGTAHYCSDCTLGANPCTAGGTGAFAIRLNGAWICGQSGGTAPPFADNAALVKNSVDATKLLIISAAGISTGTTRTLSAPNRSATIATSSGTLTSGNLTKFDASGNVVDDGIAIASLSGNTTKAVTSTGPTTSGQYVKWDASGNAVDGGTGALVSGTTTISSGLDTAICFDAAGNFTCSDPNFTWNTATQAATIGGSQAGVTNSLTVRNTNAGASSDAKVVVSSTRATGLASTVYSSNAGGNVYAVGIDGATAGLPFTIGTSATPFSSPIFRLTSAGAERLPDGTAALPARSWLNDTTSGWSSLGSGQEAYSALGTRVFSISASNAGFFANSALSSTELYVQNTSAGANADAVLEALTANGGGYPYTLYSMSLGPNWSAGASPVTSGYAIARSSSPRANVDFSISSADLVNIDSGKFGITATTFGSLGAAVNGEFRFCSDCTAVNPCGSGGAGAFARRVNGAWVCSDTPITAIANGGTGLAQVASQQVTTAGALIAAGACAAQTGVTITGLTTTSACMASVPTALPATWQTGIAMMIVVTANTATLNLCNGTAGGITPAAQAVNIKCVL